MHLVDLIALTVRSFYNSFSVRSETSHEIPTLGLRLCFSRHWYLVLVDREVQQLLHQQAQLVKRKKRITQTRLARVQQQTRPILGVSILKRRFAFDFWRNPSSLLVYLPASGVGLPDDEGCSLTLNGRGLAMFSVSRLLDLGLARIMVRLYR